jgi:hypothetical protein
LLRLAVYRQKLLPALLPARLVYFLQAGDNHAIAIFQTFSDQPFIANRLSGSDLATSTLSPSPTTMRWHRHAAYGSHPAVEPAVRQG